MKSLVVGVMQPYYFPYLGYFSHIFASDYFVLHDDVEFSKNGWINRNRFLSSTKISLLTLPLAAAPDSARISERVIAANFEPGKHFRMLEGAYRRAPFWHELRDELPELLRVETANLSNHLSSVVGRICHLLEIETPLVSSSDLDFDRELRGQARVLRICELAGAQTYLNPEGGKNLYSGQDFSRRGMDLAFISHTPRSYPQREFERKEADTASFVERLSILDMLAEIGLADTRLRVRKDFTVMRASDG